MKKNLAIIILAAGKGERMKSAVPKVLHTVCGRPMLLYVLDQVKKLKASRSVVVLGHEHARVRQHIPSGIKTVIQRKVIGTADAVKEALRALKGFRGDVLILYGDIPLLKSETLIRLVGFHRTNSPAATLLTATLKKPIGYGRIERDKYSSISGIIEEKDADEAQKDIKEVNTGIICFDAAMLAAALKEIRPNNRKKEYYLTDAINILYKAQKVIEGVKLEDITEALGINSRVELGAAGVIMQRRINELVMKQGVTLVDPATAHIGYGAKIGQDTTIYPFTVIERGVTIGKRCSIGPFVRLREGTRVSDDVTVGNFFEAVRSSIGPKTFVKHFSYLGDARVGKGVNIGAGTVTANFDGKNKQYTTIGEGAFIGSDTVLVAPVKVGKGAVTGAGSVVTHNVPAGAVVVGVPARQFKKTKR